MKSIAYLASAFLILTASMTDAASLYPEISDNSHASPEVAQILNDVFAAKSQHKPAAMMTFFSTGPMAYFDANLGWAFADHKALADMLETYMPQWPKTALSYPTRISGDTHSALVQFTDTPELFGGEIRTLGVLDFKDGKVVRWVDYWDSRSYGAEAAAKLRTLADKFPDLRYDIESDGTSAKITSVSQKLNEALAAGDAASADALFSYDAVYEDMALRAQIRGKLAIGKYLERVLAKAPYGKNAKLVHVVGSDQGGGYEWVNADNSVERGVIAIDLDEAGQIMRLTTTWDNGVMSDSDYQALAAATAP